MPKTKEQRVAQAKSNIFKLVGQGHRLNKKAHTSRTYQQALADYGTPKERRVASATQTMMSGSPTGKAKDYKKGGFR